MMIRTYDSFISYRRNTGSQLASRIYDYLLSKNRAPFWTLRKSTAEI